MSTLDERLWAIVGEEDLLKDTDAIAPYFKQPIEETELRVLLPEKVEEVQAILKLAREEGFPVFTTYDTFFPQEVAGFRKGFLLDFRRMNRIEKIDVKNLAVHIQRGVTYEQLAEELSRLGVKVLPPAAATSRSVVAQSVCRAINLRAARYPEVPVSNMQVVLADGRVQLTGAHALSEEGSNHKEDGGPNLTRWYLCAEDIFGIVTRATIWLFPIWEERKVYFFGFDSLEGASALIRDLPRYELALEAIALNKKALTRLAAVEDDGFPPWVAIIGLEGKKKLVKYREKLVREMAGKKGGSDLTARLEGAAGIVDRPWYAIEQPELSFYTTFNRIGEFDETIERALAGTGCSLNDASRKVVATHYGGGAWLGYAFPGEVADEVVEKLVEKGAFFDRPTGKVAEAVYARMAPYVRHIRRIKKLLDPGNLLNPGIPFKMEEVNLGW